jgi:ATP-binding cassette subfamily B (MDR/TAP) protein 1
MAIGLISSIIAGAGNPVSAIFFAKEVVAFTLPPKDYGTLRHDVNFWSLMFLMLGIVLFFAFCIQGLAFAYCSERLIFRVRDQAFRAMLRQDIVFFDMEENSSGALTSFLSTESSRLAGMSGTILGSILNLLTTIITALVLSLAIGWKLGLVCGSTIPVLLTCGYLRYYMLAEFDRRSKRAYDISASYACEATSAVRTVASLTMEEAVWKHYHDLLAEQTKKSIMSIVQISNFYAASQSFNMFCLALGFWYGGTLIAAREYTMFQFFVCFISIVFGSQSAGALFSFAPDMGSAKQAAQQLKTLFDRKPEIDSWSQHGDMLDNVEGMIEFRDVHFRYPMRPEQPVLRGLDLAVKPGQYVALVGPSGCGKSTTISLLERFYDPRAGGIFLDGKDISSVNLKHYRSHLALVSQEPTLYDGTIRENILLGSEEDDVSETRVTQACKDANIYDFIVSSIAWGAFAAANSSF